jgi:hypothetical protein
MIATRLSRRADSAKAGTYTAPITIEAVAPNAAS